MITYICSSWSKIFFFHFWMNFAILSFVSYTWFFYFHCCGTTMAAEMEHFTSITMIVPRLYLQIIWWIFLPCLAQYLKIDRQHNYWIIEFWFVWSGKNLIWSQSGNSQMNSERYLAFHWSLKCLETSFFRRRTRVYVFHSRRSIIYTIC